MSRLHETFHRASEEVGARPVTLGEVCDLHGNASQGALLVLLAVPSLLPVPGAGTLMSVGLAAMAVALWRGQQAGALPGRVAQLSMAPNWARRVLKSLAWFYAQAGRWSRSRLTGLTEPTHRHWVALWVAAMALLIALPLPLGNILPALGLVMLGLGLVFRDGVAVLAGVAVGVLALTVTVGLGVWALDSATPWLQRL